MEENAITTPSNKTSVETMAKFVAGAVEMETQIYTLEAAIENHWNEKKHLEDTNNRNLQTAQWKLNNAKETYERNEKEAKNYSYGAYLRDRRRSKTGGQKFGAFIGWLFFHYIFGTITAVMTTFLVCNEGDPNGNNFSVGILLFMYLVYFLIFFAIRTIIKRNRYSDEKESRELQAKESKTELEKAEKNFSDTTHEYNNNLRVAAKIEEQISFLEQSVEELKNQLETYYQKNIVPPNYRNLLCVVVIDYVFRNDQADTMREATLLCDQRIRHKEVMEGFKDLTETMRGLGGALNNLLGTIDDISRDIKSLSSSQNALISETKASRYATEALKSSAERLEWAMWYKN